MSQQTLAPRGKSCAYLRHMGERGCLLPWHAVCAGNLLEVSRGTDDVSTLDGFP